MRKRKLLYFDIEEPIFGSLVNFVIDCDLPEAIAYIEKNCTEMTIDTSGLKTENVGYAMTFRHEQKVLRIVWLKNFDWSTVEYGALQHEVNHIARQILESHSIEVNEHTDETFCRLSEYYFVQALFELKKIHPRTKKRAKIKKKYGNARKNTKR